MDFEKLLEEAAGKKLASAAMAVRTLAAAAAVQAGQSGFDDDLELVRSVDRHFPETLKKTTPPCSFCLLQGLEDTFKIGVVFFF